MKSDSEEVVSKCEVIYDTTKKCQFEISQNLGEDMGMTRFFPPMTLDIAPLMLYNAFLGIGGTIVWLFKLESIIDVTKFFLAIHVFYPKLLLMYKLIR